MFSKALFKQSCKANGTMWAIITFAVCFMLACVMLISGNGNIGEVKNAIEDTIIIKEVDAQMQKRALSYYQNAYDGLMKFDELFTDNATDTLYYLMWYEKMPIEENYQNANEYNIAINTWQEKMPILKTETGIQYQESIKNFIQQMPQRSDYSSDTEYQDAIKKYQKNSPLTKENAITIAYTDACTSLQTYIYNNAKTLGYNEESTEANEMLGSVMYVLNPNKMFNDFYIENGENVPADYDYMSIILHITTDDAKDYLKSDERLEYIEKRTTNGSTIFLAGNMTKAENVKLLTEALSSYGVTKEKYDSFGYTYSKIKDMATTSIVTYKARISYELEKLENAYKNGEFLNENEYLVAITNKKESLAKEISSSFLSTLPDTVSEALEEIGKTDLYTLIVGSIFYKLAGLLLPIIYMIMASNNLISTQVDTGSMAYILSTSTKRITVIVTQSIYLIGSLLAMFLLTTITGCICLSLITETVGLTYGKLILLNVGAFLVLFALSGLCFFTSCIFDRSKHSMAIGGGLSIFALVAAMLGLFGSPVIPSVVRLDALNSFNYVTIISLFDVISIINGTTTFLLKFIILIVLGIIGYIIGGYRFTKKDLPL